MRYSSPKCTVLCPSGGAEINIKKDDDDDYDDDDDDGRNTKFN